MNFEAVYPNINDRLINLDPFNRLMFVETVKGAVNIMKANFHLVFTKTRKRPTVVTRYLIRYMLCKRTGMNQKLIAKLTQEQGSADHSILNHNIKTWEREASRSPEFKEYQKKLEIYLDQITIENSSIKGPAIFIVNGWKCSTLEEVHDHLWEYYDVKFEY